MPLREDWVDGQDVDAAVMNEIGTEVNGKAAKDTLGDLPTIVGLKIVEISPGVWSDDAPARAEGEYPITFVGEDDPEGPNGIDTPGNINFTDDWVTPSAGA